MSRQASPGHRIVIAFSSLDDAMSTASQRSGASEIKMAIDDAGAVFHARLKAIRQRRRCAPLARATCPRDGLPYGVAAAARSPCLFSRPAIGLPGRLNVGRRAKNYSRRLCRLLPRPVASPSCRCHTMPQPMRRRSSIKSHIEPPRCQPFSRDSDAMPRFCRKQRKRRSIAMNRAHAGQSTRSIRHTDEWNMAEHCRVEALRASPTMS